MLLPIKNKAGILPDYDKKTKIFRRPDSYRNIFLKNLRGSAKVYTPSELYRAKWTNRIHDEWISSLVNKRPDLSREKLEKTRLLINASVEDALVEGYEALVETLDLPDTDDRHVLAAAIKSQAQIIVTYNLKDFPADILNPLGIEAQHPDDFFLNQSDLQQGAFLTAVKSIRKSLLKPPKTAEEYLNVLRRCDLPKTAQYLENFIELI